ncbi:MAG: response regulator transcription factor [Pseudomonadota bacterium]
MSSSRAVSVFVVEDDPATRRSLVHKIESADGLSVAGSAATLESARQKLKALRPDAFLIDLQLPDGDGSDLIAELTHRRPAAPVLVMSVFGDERSVVRAIGAGAQGYLLKDAPGEDLAEAIEQVSTGQSPISPGIAKHIIRRFQQSAGTTPLVSAQDDEQTLLSGREFEILQLASKGLSSKEMAEALELSVNTIGTYTRRVYTKLAVTSRAEALFEARQLGLIDG